MVLGAPRTAAPHARGLRPGRAARDPPILSSRGALLDASLWQRRRLQTKMLPPGLKPARTSRSSRHSPTTVQKPRPRRLPDQTSCGRAFPTGFPRRVEGAARVIRKRSSLDRSPVVGACSTVASAEYGVLRPSQLLVEDVVRLRRKCQYLLRCHQRTGSCILREEQFEAGSYVGGGTGHHAAIGAGFRRGSTNTVHGLH